MTKTKSRATTRPRTTISEAERRRLILGEEAEPEPRSEPPARQPDSPQDIASRKLTLWLCVIGLMGIILFGWHRTIGSSITTVPMASPTSRSQDWQDLKSEIQKIYEDTQATEEAVGEGGAAQEGVVTGEAGSDDGAVGQASVSEGEVGGQAETGATDNNSAGVVDTTGWQEWQSPAYSISGRYPQTWFWEEKAEDKMIELRTSPQDILLGSGETEGLASGSAVQISIADNPDALSLQDWFVAHKDDFPSLMFESVSVGGEAGLSAQPLDGMLGCQASYFVAQGALVYRLAFCNTSENYEQKNRPTFDEIIKAVVFLK